MGSLFNSQGQVIPNGELRFARGTVRFEKQALKVRADDKGYYVADKLTPGNWNAYYHPPLPKGESDPMASPLLGSVEVLPNQTAVLDCVVGDRSVEGSYFVSDAPDIALQFELYPKLEPNRLVATGWFEQPEDKRLKRSLTIPPTLQELRDNKTDDDLWGAWLEASQKPTEPPPGPPAALLRIDGLEADVYVLRIISGNEGGKPDKYLYIEREVDLTVEQHVVLPLETFTLEEFLKATWRRDRGL